LYQMALNEMRFAMGQPIPAEDKARLDLERGKFFADETNELAAAALKDREPLRKLIVDMRKDLDYADATGEYKTTYMKKAEEADARAEKALASLKTEQKSHDDLKKQWKK